MSGDSLSNHASVPGTIGVPAAMQLNLIPAQAGRSGEPRSWTLGRSALHFATKWRARALWQQVAVALIAVVVALSVRLIWLDALGMRLAYVTLFPATTVAAVLGGMVGGLVALIGGALAASLWLAPLQEPADWLGLVAFVGGSLLMIVITEAMHIAQERAAASEVDARLAGVLRGSEARLRLFVEQAPAAIALFGRDHKLLAASRRWIDGYGSASGEHDAPSVRRWDDTLRRVLAGECVANAADPLTKADGSVHWQRWEALPWRDVGDTLSGVSIFAEDITARTEAERALRESEARLKAIVDNSIDAIITANANGIITSVNPATMRLFGYAAEELIGRNLSVLMPEAHKRAHDTYLKNHSMAGGSKVIGKQRPLEARRKDGTNFPVELAVTQAMSRDGAVFIGVLRDITQRVRAENSLREAQKLEAVGQLTGGIAHDFNNLLTVIICNLELLEMRTEDDTKRKLVRKALDAADMGHRLTDRLLAFARRQPLSPELLDVNSIVRNLQDMLQRAVGATITLTTSLDDRAWTVLADRGQLESAIVNLALNSRDAMAAGGRLVIRTRNVLVSDGQPQGADFLPKGRYLEVAVTDTGTGMTSEVKERAFEPFYTTKPPGRGTGLGLAAVYGFVKQSGGNVSIDSEPGRGTTIRLYLSALAGLDVRADENPSRAGADGRELQGLDVLVVEDESALREAVAAHLRSLQVNVVEAANGAEALIKLGTGRAFDVVVTDLIMPGPVSGLALAECVRRDHRESRLLLMSGFADEVASPDRIETLNAPLLRKPFRLAQLVEAIRALMERGADAGTSMPTTAG